LEAFGLNSLGDLPAVDLDALQSREVELPMTVPRESGAEPPETNEEVGELSLA
jgi:hypothetical protein